MNKDDEEKQYAKLAADLLTGKYSAFIGIDWAKDSGKNRGEVHKREGNVVHVRFKTVS